MNVFETNGNVKSLSRKSNRYFRVVFFKIKKQNKLNRWLHSRIEEKGKKP